MDKNRESLAEFLGRHPGIVTEEKSGRYRQMESHELLHEVKRQLCSIPDAVYAAGFDHWRQS